MPAAKPPNIKKITCRLLESDVARIKRRARETGAISWQDELRRLVHEALDTPPVRSGNEKIFKFIIGPAGKPDAERPTELTWAAMSASAVADNEEDARQVILTRNAQNGRDSRWLAVADVVILPCASGTFIMQSWA